jgi:hypothetical protein
MVTVPVRTPPPVNAEELAATVNVTAPFPVPPPVVVMNAEFDVAVHAQVLAVATFTTDDPPVALIGTANGETAYVQLGSTAVDDGSSLQADIPTRAAIPRISKVSHSISPRTPGGPTTGASLLAKRRLRNLPATTGD